MSWVSAESRAAQENARRGLVSPAGEYSVVLPKAACVQLLTAANLCLNALDHLLPRQVHPEAGPPHQTAVAVPGRILPERVARPPADRPSGPTSSGAADTREGQTVA